MFALLNYLASKDSVAERKVNVANVKQAYTCSLLYSFSFYRFENVKIKKLEETKWKENENCKKDRKTVKIRQVEDYDGRHISRLSITPINVNGLRAPVKREVGKLY